MSFKMVAWALQNAPLLPGGPGGGPTARLNLIARCEQQRDGQDSHYLSVPDLMYRTGLSARAVKTSTKALEDAGLIVRKGVSSAGIPCYSINSTAVREDTLADFQSARQLERHAGKGTDESDRGSEDPGTGVPDAPVTGVLSAPGVLNAPGVPGALYRGTECPQTGPVKETTTTADAVVGEDPATSTKPRKRRAPKDPAKDAAAHDLAGRYYEAMRRQANFIAVRGVVRRALDTFTADEVTRGLKAMTEGRNRNRPLTRLTLLAAVEGYAQPQRGTTHASQPLPAVGEYPDDPLGATA